VSAELERIRADSVEIQDSLFSSYRDIDARNKATAAAIKLLSAKWHESGPHPVNQNQQFVQLIQNITASRGQVSQFLLGIARAKTTRSLELLDPIILNPSMKIEYATKIRRGLVDEQNTMLPRLLELLDAVNSSAKPFQAFVEANTPDQLLNHRENVSVQKGDDKELETAMPSDVDDIEYEPLVIHTRDEFLDDPEFRSVVKVLLSSFISPMEELGAQWFSLIESDAECHARVVKWAAVTARPVEKTRWIAGLFKEKAEMYKSTSLALKELTAGGRLANRAYSAATDQNGVSAVIALKELVDTRRVLTAELIPRAVFSLNRSMTLSEEILAYIDRAMEDVYPPKSQKLWRRRR
jgi:hypothetical protein